MKIWLKKAGILFSVTAACAAITGITPFFPEIAVERGIPEWSIGFIFAACPFASLLTSLRLSILLEKLGRKTVMLVGVFLLAVSNFIMALVWFSDEYMAIFESVSSRVLAGVGCAFSMTSAYAAATSDFTEEAAKMIAMIEIFCGLGLILGPAFASTFYGLVGFLYCCIIVGSFILISLPALYFILDNSRSYVIVNEGGRVKLRSILLKPKVAIDVVMQFSLMFSFGFVSTTTEFQLLDYGIDRSQVGFWYSIWTSAYLVSCAFVSRILDRFSKTRTMMIGIFGMSIAFLFLGPCPFIFPPSIVLVAFGLAFVGLSAGFLYVPTVPHILEVLKYVYDFEVDDRVHDSMAAITNISLCLGEIVGPIMSSLLYYEIGYAWSTFVAAVILLSYGIIYAILSKPTNFGVVENVSLLTIKNNESDLKELNT